MKDKLQLTKEEKESISNYSIRTITDFVEAVRKTPGQYIGYLGNKGFINMIREIIQNSFDEVMKTDFCKYIAVSYDERTHMFINTDTGRGIPFDNIIRVFATQHTSSNFEKKEGEFSSGRHGVGSKVTNALSSQFFVESYNSILKEARRVEFYDGKPWDKGELKIPNKEGKQGTNISFIPSYEIMGEITTTWQDVLQLISTLLPLVKIGTVVDFNAIDANGNVYSERLVNQDGIITDLINKTTSPVIKPIIMEKLTGRMKANIAFTYDSNDLMVENITSFGNFCPTIAGTHVNGFIEGLTKFFREYVNKIFLKGSGKITVVNNDIKTGLKAIISVAHLEPTFSGQAKEILSNDDMYWFVRNLVLESLDQWAKENPNDLQKLCKYFKDIAEIRVKSDENKVTISKKYDASSITNLPKKYRKPSGNKDLELIVIEGDSALSSAMGARCPRRQGIYPLKGKVPNALQTTKKKFIENEEINGLMHLISDGKYGKNFDPETCKWSRIILVPDADADGHHIRSLLVKFFILYYPQLILAGKLYGAVPPLYGLKDKKEGYRYFTTKLDIVRYIQNKFKSVNVITREDGMSFTNNEIMDILYTNMDYVYDIEKVANTYAIKPYVLEQCLYNRNLSFDSFKDNLMKTNRFLQSVEFEKNSIVIKGLVDDKFHTIIFNEKLLKDCDDLLKYIDGKRLYYKLNDKIVSLYGLMKCFDQFKPPGITRFKGLGEMNPAQLKESTLHPDANRTLMKFNIEDLERDLETIRYINFNKDELLKDINISKMGLI